MVKQTEFQTSPFTIAHYILLFMVTVVCISIVTWLIIDRYNNNAKTDVAVSYMLSADPCVVRTRDAIKKMWSYNQELIPVRYKTMAETYANNTVLSRVNGYCNDTAFTCRAGQLRRTCDPCAVEVGRRRAMELHILDSVRANCDAIIDDKK